MSALAPARAAAVAAASTTPPGGDRLLVLFDGHCRFCTRSANRLAAVLNRRAGGERARAVDFQEDGVLASFPGIPYEACMKRLHVVDPAGNVYAGAAGVARVLRDLPFIGWLAYVYYLPIVKQLADFGYWLVAKYRYRLFGRNECEPGGTCHLHG